MPSKKKVKKKLNFLSFQEIIMNLQKFWGKYGCVILQPYDIEVGAGTFHPATTLRSAPAVSVRSTVSLPLKTRGDTHAVVESIA